MTRATSKESYKEIKASGAEARQEDKILAIISKYTGVSMQEIMRDYRASYGPIELSSVSARCNLLKENKLIEEIGKRPCTVSGKSVNILVKKAACQHDRYRTKEYQQVGKLTKNVAWHSKAIQTCEDCGEDISKYSLVRVKTGAEYIGGL